jgi:hypothetical protein
MSLTPVDGVGTVHLPIVSIIGVVGVWLWRTVRPMVGWMRLRRVIGRGR